MRLMKVYVILNISKKVHMIKTVKDTACTLYYILAHVRRMGSKHNDSQ